MSELLFFFFFFFFFCLLPLYWSALRGLSLVECEKGNIRDKNEKDEIDLKELGKAEGRKERERKK